MVESFFPDSVAGLYTPECVEYRKGSNERIKRILKHRAQLATTPFYEQAYLAYILEAFDNLIIPFPEILEELEAPFDIIGVSGMKHGRCFMFLEQNSPKTQTQEGFGKTALALKLLGIEMPYASIPSQLEEIAESVSFELLPQDTGCKLLSSNMSYIGNNSGRLALALSIGEPGWASWDLARHVYRVKGLYDVYGARSNPQARSYLTLLAERLLLDMECFGSNTQLHLPDALFIISRNPSEEPRYVKYEVLEGEQALRVLEQVLVVNPIYHSSTFWAVDEREHKARVNKLVNAITKLPAVLKLELSAERGQLPIDAAAETIERVLLS